jgi:hypothetical protein
VICSHLAAGLFFTERDIENPARSHLAGFRPSVTGRGIGGVAEGRHNHIVAPMLRRNKAVRNIEILMPRVEDRETGVAWPPSFMSTRTRAACWRDRRGRIGYSVPCSPTRLMVTKTVTNSTARTPLAAHAGGWPYLGRT